ncbi:alkaline phosphatase family protein [Streptantibioticus ferralitis]|uniref:Alkaline phosphatase family protein n=1 Tax=Streptantibioticus ferralitis TaxID=236510 RepID=A0ABT5YYJ7_9ACTN|nr:alkaline phosphatase family protein [Streptantibioticus ferralitis]MDF2256573.1 alkaline phosphatase family protein [Streptantibioticus ferralitis]
MAVVDHVIVLALENRSFDHMLGFVEHPNPKFDGLTRGGPHTNPGWDSAAPVTAEPRAKTALPIDPDHSHDAVMEQLALRGTAGAASPTNQGFVMSLERKGRGLSPPTYGGALGPLLNWWHARGGPTRPAAAGLGPLAMLCQPPAHVPVLSRLALEFAVCTRWFCSLPGETWPNRNFLHAATSDGEVDIDLRAYTNRTIFELLEEEGTTDHARTWHIYHDDTPQVWAFRRLWDTPERHANWFPASAFADHVAAGKLPAYSFIEPNHRPPLHTLDHDPIIGAPDVSNNQHPGNNQVDAGGYPAFADASPDSDFSRGEALIAGVYQALRANPALFARSVLLITYDEHGGLYDHVPPPVGVPSPADAGTQGPGWAARLQHSLCHRKAETFDFTLLGPRVPAVIVSPLVAAGTVDARVRDHAAVPATLRALFAPHARPLTRRDEWATPFHSVLTLAEPRTDLPDLSGYVGATPGATGLNVTAPDAPYPAEAPSHYRDFARQAELVWRHLAHVGEPEVSQPPASTQPQRAVQITEAFAAAAHRHRSVAAGDQP